MILFEICFKLIGLTSSDFLFFVICDRLEPVLRWIQATMQTFFSGPLCTDINDRYQVSISFTFYYTSI